MLSLTFSFHSIDIPPESIYNVRRKMIEDCAMIQNYTFGIDEFATELKQHINLSEHAWQVITDDIHNFYPSEKQESFSGFLNTIFKNFYQSANASISLRFIEKADELEKLYSSKEFKSLDKKLITLFIDKYTHVYESELIETAHSYEKGHGEKFRLNKDSLAILKESTEGEYYEGILGQYLKAIFEEYALKPAYVRERIFFADTVNKIELAIGKQRKLKLILNEKVTVKEDARYNLKYYVSPYKIVQDKNCQFNYLVGYAEKITENETPDANGIPRKSSEVGEKDIRCFRISRINQIGVMTSMGAHISEENKKRLNEELVRRTPMYMSGEPTDIKVKFTDKGLESFKRQLYMRPEFYHVDQKDKHIYHFRCTEYQLINYLWKFGWDAYVMEPESLTQKFKIRYERALKSYNGMSKDEIFESEKAEEASEDNTK